MDIPKIPDNRVLIVDDDRELCSCLQEMFSTWGIKADAIAEPERAVDQVRGTSYNIVLLDIIMPEKSGFDLIPEIVKLCPGPKIIIMTGYADKEKVVKALRMGVFDFLEKPVEMELLSYTVQRALHSQKIELDYKNTLKDLEQSQHDLLLHKNTLEQVNKQLLETNKALSVLAKNLESTREESEKQIVQKIRSWIIPIVEKLQRDKNLRRYKAELDMLIGHIENMTSGLAGHARIAFCLTSTELRIASMIMGGLTSLEIAGQLNISPDTVKTHRKNIRKKLNVKHSNINLRSYLESEMGAG